MKPKAEKPFATEVDLCSTFLRVVPPDWTAYPETAGWDILLVRKMDGFQIGVQAKLRLNAEVLTQACEEGHGWSATREGPDCRAVLVPRDDAGHFDKIAGYIGVTVIRVTAKPRSWDRTFTPELPMLVRDVYADSYWFELAPTKRHRLPEYVPDVVAGDKAPVQLTRWKIQAIKLAVTLDKRGYLTRADFKFFRVDHRRWIAPGSTWLKTEGRQYVRGATMPDFRIPHPRVYAEITADYDNWKSPANPT